MLPHTGLFLLEKVALQMRIRCRLKTAAAYAKSVGIAADQLINAVLGGRPSETLSVLGVLDAQNIGGGTGSNFQHKKTEQFFL